VRNRRSTMPAVMGATALAVVIAAGPGMAGAAQAPAGNLGARAQAAQQQRPGARQRPPGFGTRDDTLRKDYRGPSVIKGQPPGIKAGKYAADFQLEPVQLYPQLKQWLGDKAPRRFEDKVMLSDLIGKQPVILFFGSYT